MNTDQAIDHYSAQAQAERLGARIEPFYEDEWIWCHGTHVRSSLDHYGKSFKSVRAAAEHFLQSREGQAAQRLANK